MWKLVYKWATHSHPNKPKHWIMSRYFGAFNKSRRDRWVFGDCEGGAYLAKSAWTRIVRHQLVKGHRPPTIPPWASTGSIAAAMDHPCRFAVKAARNGF